MRLPVQRLHQIQETCSNSKQQPSCYHLYKCSPIWISNVELQNRCLHPSCFSDVGSLTSLCETGRFDLSEVAQIWTSAENHSVLGHNYFTSSLYQCNQTRQSNSCSCQFTAPSSRCQPFSWSVSPLVAKEWKALAGDGDILFRTRNSLLSGSCTKTLWLTEGSLTLKYTNKPFHRGVVWQHKEGIFKKTPALMTSKGLQTGMPRVLLQI